MFFVYPLTRICCHKTKQWDLFYFHFSSIGVSSFSILRFTNQLKSLKQTTRKYFFAEKKKVEEKVKFNAQPVQDNETNVNLFNVMTDKIDPRRRKFPHTRRFYWGSVKVITLIVTWNCYFRENLEINSFLNHRVAAEHPTRVISVKAMEN